MALSDWDMAGWDEAGRPTGARFDAGAGRSLEIARGSVLVGDEAAWQEGGDWMRPFVARLHRGDGGLHEVAGFRILVSKGRDRQQVFRFLAAWDGDGGARVVGGIACYGWTETFDILAETCRRYGVAVGDRSDWNGSSSYGHDRLREQAFVRGRERLVWWRGGERDDMPSADVRPGVLAEDHLDFLDWVQATLDDPADPLRAAGALRSWLASVRASGCLRISQGDAFIADKLELAEAPFSPPGEAAMPLVSAMLGMGIRPPITRLPHRPLAEWIHDRAMLAARSGRLRPGQGPGSAPAVHRRVSEEMARGEAARGPMPPSVRMRRMRERAVRRRQG